MAIEPNQGGDTPIDSLSGRGRTSSQGRLQADTAVIDRLTTSFSRLREELRRLKTQATETMSALTGVSRVAGGATGTGAGAGVAQSGTRNSMPAPGATTRNAVSQVASRVSARFGGGGGGAGGLTGGATGGLTGGTGGGGGGGGGGSITNLMKTLAQPSMDAMQAISGRVARGAEYSLQADRMSVQLQQMYGMSNSQVRNQLRMPLTSHYLLGGGTAINDLLSMQANTGLTAAKQASTVEAMRTVSGFSLGSGDVTRMLSTMASPDVANRMFMMGGTGMYGIGGKERTGMQSIQDIVRRTGLTNPEALKGALQQGSNTRQRLTAMGVPQDMQDMVIQYAMQNTQYQRKTGDKSTMYDPSLESNRETMGIEGSYAVQHEKTTGERLKREESFYGRQTDNFARFEKNLRTSTKVLAAFEDALSGIIGMGINAQGHPITNVLKYGAKQGINTMMATIDVGEMAAGAMIPGAGDAGDGRSGDSGDGIKPADEKKLATLDAKLAAPLRNMLAANPKLYIGDALRSGEQQERSFKERYRPTNRSLDTKGENDRIWNGVLWEMKPGNSYPMAAPGNSFHEIGLAADVQGDPEWVRANASKYGLSHGGTTKGQRSDEPFHVQPAGTLTRKKSSVPSSSSASSGKVNTASAKKAPLATSRYTPSSSSSGGGSFTDAGQRASQVSSAGIKAQFSPIIAGIDKPSTFNGDAGDGRMSASGYGGGGGHTITVAPNIYLNGTQDIGNDIKRIAREVGKILEQEVSMVMARSR